MIQPALSFDTKTLSQDPYWLRLLHYRRNLFGIYQSEIDDPSFFASPRGRRDPQAEMDATLAAFFAPAPSGPNAQQGVCRYPLRFAWLSKKLGIDSSKLPPHDCSRFEKWRAQMDPESAAVIFASSYMNNPSSMYGHTFLLLKKKGQANNELLDYAVNFAADMETDNGFLFAMKGLMGGYHGRFSTFPYYMKVQEYSNLESRDLWKYDLNLSSAALDRLVEHLWELGNVRIRYFFLNKNCSYYLMPLLDVVEPGRDFSKEFVFKAIPVDTVRAVQRQPGLVGAVTRRPSHTTKLIAERACLTEPQIKLAEKIAVTPERTDDPLVLDAAYDLFRYRVGFSREQKPEVEEKEHSLLDLRSHINAASPPLQIPDIAPPDAGHPTGRLGISYGFSNHSHFEEFSLRPAVHDQEDPPEGYLPGSKLEMFDAKLRYDNDRQTLYLEKFALIDMMSITPWDRWIHPPSWKVNSGFAVAHDLNRDPENSLYYGLNLGTGYSAYWPGTDKLLFYGMGELDLQLGHEFTDSVRFGGGPSGGLLWTPVKFARSRLAASYFPYAVGGTPSTTKLGFYQSFSLSKRFEFRASLERENTYKEVLLSVEYYL